LVKDNKDKVALANPITYIDADDPPFMIIHGTADQTVPPCESYYLDQALRKAGVQSKYVTVSGGGHGTGTTVEPYIGQMVAFFNDVKAAMTAGTAWRPRASGIRAPSGSFYVLGRACRESLRNPVSDIPHSLGSATTGSTSN
jgi:pimeloyl-ACP methyl ester carboxylesterase